MDTQRTEPQRAHDLAVVCDQMHTQAERGAQHAAETATVVTILRERIRVLVEEQAGCELAAESEPCSEWAARQMHRATRTAEAISALRLAILALEHPRGSWRQDED